MAEVTAQASPIIAEMAKKYGLTEEAFIKTLISEVFPSEVSGKPFRPTPQQIATFLVVAQQYNLNPFTKEVWAFPARGTLIPTVSVDGWSRIINEHPQMDGIEFADKFNEAGFIESVTCSIFRKDRAHPTVMTEYLRECTRGTPMWKQWPTRMLRWKALIQTARMAFGFAGIFEKDEAERIAENTPAVEGAATAAGTSDLRNKIQKAKNYVNEAAAEADAAMQKSDKSDTTPINDATVDASQFV